MTAPSRLRQHMAGALRAIVAAAEELQAVGLDDDAARWLAAHDDLAVLALNAPLRISQTRRMRRIQTEEE